MVSGDPTNEGAASILRAVGSLLVALSGGQATQVESTLSALQGAPAAASLPSSPPRSTLRPRAGESSTPASTPGYPRPQGRPSTQSNATPSDLIDDVELVLSDARERAQAIIDESTERARELIRDERARSGATQGIGSHAFEELRGGLRNLVTEVRDIQQRLARIEQLIREQNERAVHQVATTPASGAPPEPQYAEPEYDEPQYAEPQYAEPQYAEPQYAEPRYAEPQHAEPQYAEPQYAEPQYDEPQYNEPQYAEPQYDEPQYDDTGPGEDEAEGAERADDTTFIPTPAPPRSSFSVVPPQRREWGGADAVGGEPSVPGGDVEPVVAAAYEPAYEPPPSPPRTGDSTAAELAPDADGWDDDEAYDEATAAGEGGSPLVTFLPSDGAITLRVAPVAGFQGLMRVQEALTRLRAVRSAAVDTYSQGEARLHIELADTSDSDEIAEGLSRALGGSARVEDASEVHRELFITLR